MRSVALGLLAAASLSVPGFAAEPNGPASLITPAEGLRITVQGLVSTKSDADTAQRDALVEYYGAPDRNLLWVDENGLTQRAKLVMAEIAKADDYGLRASDYSLPDAASFNASDANAKDWLADSETKVSYAVLDYAKDARGGRIEPVRVSKNLDPTLALPNPSEVLESIAIRSDPAAYLRSFQPDQPQFEALRQKLIELRGGKVEEVKEDIVVIPAGPVLKFGMEHEQVALLRKRLDLPAGSNENKYDEAVREAVRAFQSSRGVAADGAVGPGTRRLLNQGQQARPVGGEARIRQILVNMERWRWLPHDLGPFYVTVNIPEFTLRVVEEGTPIHTARVVVGKPKTQTPVISDEMEEVVFNPYWNVPNSIKNEEIAPYMGPRRRLLRRRLGHGRAQASRFAHQIRQPRHRSRFDRLEPKRHPQVRSRAAARTLQRARPGEVLVPQSARRLHARYDAEVPVRQRRARREPRLHARAESQSPGAGDLEKGQRLERGPGRIDVRCRRRHHVVLDQKIPVYITYFTLRVNEDGSFTSFNDLYGHDSRMTAALEGRGYISEPSYDNEQVVAGEWRPNMRRGPGRGSFGSDFTRGLFGF